MVAQRVLGYPQDRQVYATWAKPVVVLCNRNSFSNAEIFSHAIKTLGPGRLVGVTTDTNVGTGRRAGPTSRRRVPLLVYGGFFNNLAGLPCCTENVLDINCGECIV